MGKDIVAKVDLLVGLVEALQLKQAELVTLVIAQAGQLAAAQLPALLSIKQAAFQLGVSVSGLNRLRAQGRLLSVMIGEKPMVPKSEIARLSATSADEERDATYSPTSAKDEAEIRASFKRTRKS